MKPSTAPSSTRPARAATPRVLVAIASYGTKNLSLLRRVVSAWQSMPFDVHVVVLSEAPKDLGPGIEVAVGLPVRNPWSLPFAHKPISAANAHRYDLFAYSEDDMEVTAAHVEAFIELDRDLQANEIAGFLRYEEDARGDRSFPDLHAHFHWKPDAVRRRGAHVVSEFTNEHAAFYLMTRSQLQRAIASGGFLRAPCEGRYDMLCTAATDPYTHCGLRKVISVSALDRFMIHHLSDRYVQRWCVPWGAVREQLQAQRDIASGRLPDAALMNTESRLTRGEWSKNYYEPADDELVALLPSPAKTVLSVGCGWGATEERLQRRGAAVTALPLDAVIGACAAARGLEIVHGTFEQALQRLHGRRFDAVVIANLLHLTCDPTGLLLQSAACVAPRGALLVRGPNFGSMRVLVKRALALGEHERLRSPADGGIHTVGPGQVRRALRAEGFRTAVVRWSRGRVDHVVDRVPGRLGAASWVLRAERDLR